MSDSTQQDDRPTEAGASILGFFSTVVSLAVVLLIAIGLVATTARWHTARIELVGADRVKVTQKTWWGAVSDQKVYRAGKAGRAELKDGGDEVPPSQQPVAMEF